MKMFMLMIMFSTPMEPVPHEEPEWGPRFTTTMDDCLYKRSSTQRYLEHVIQNPHVKFKAFCVEFNAVGYDEAIDSFNRQLGDDM